jgi:hypothetical protein
VSDQNDSKVKERNEEYLEFDEEDITAFGLP